MKPQNTQKTRKVAPKKDRSFAVVNVQFLLDQKDCDRLNAVVEDWNKRLPNGPTKWTAQTVLAVEAMAELRRDADKIAQQAAGSEVGV